MRTTLTLDPDVAHGLARMRERDGSTLKAAVNHLLRLGLAKHARASEPSPRISTEPVSLGGCLVGSLDDLADVLALAEGEGFR